MPEPSLYKFPEVRVVEASAGSGKTYALAKRYIQLLLHPSMDDPLPIRRILAITFTNKAAFEMKGRILDFLKKIALGRLSESERANLLDPLNATPADAGEKSFRMMDDLIRNYNFFQVQTIDSFINTLLAGCAFKINLSANFKIKRNSRDYLEQSLDLLIDAASRDAQIKNIFDHFLRQYLFLENRTGWFPKKDLLSLLCVLFSQNNTYPQAFKFYDLKPNELFELKKKILGLMKDLKENLPEFTHAGFVKSLNAFVAKHPRSFDLDKVSAYFEREQFPITKGKPVPEKVEKVWDDIHESLSELCRKEAYGVFNSYLEVFTLVMHIFYQLASRDDVLFLEELNKKARYLFDEGAITVEELYYRLATRFQHYLIDEFQDTSSLQWKNLYLMVEEALSTGGSLFYVGDKKQAIYGFRGGDSRLFDAIKEQFGPFNVQTESLEKNYRSHKNVVEFVNDVFSMDNLHRFFAAKEEHEVQTKKENVVALTLQDHADLEQIFHNSRQICRDDLTGGYVRLRHIDAERKEDIDRLTKKEILALVAEVVTRFNYGDIAILTRGNKEVEEITYWLLEAGIPVESERTSDITQNPVIIEFVAFLRFLDSPIDNVSFATFILGDVFAKVSGIPGEELHAFIFGLRDELRAKNEMYLYKGFQKAYPEVWERLFEGFFKNVGLYPLYEFTVTILKRFECQTHFPQYQGFLMHFLELVKKQEEERSDLSSFLDYFDHLQNEDLYVPIADHNAVRILTIHKSKGLEFPVVIIPYLAMDVQVGSSAQEGPTFVLEFDDDGIQLVKLKDKYYGYCSDLAEIHTRQYKKAMFTELNNIYVALTRPICELYAFIPKKTGGSTNLVPFLIPEGLMERGSPEKKSGAKRLEKQPRVKLGQAHLHDWLELLHEEFMVADRVADRAQAAKGEVAHFVLSLLDNLTGGGDEVWETAFAQARVKFPLVEDWNAYETTLRSMVEKPELKPFFSVEDGELYAEREIIDRNGQTRRIDRLIVTKTEAWIVDYKTSRADFDKHTAQVRNYIELVGLMYPALVVKGYIIFLDEGTVHEIS